MLHIVAATDDTHEKQARQKTKRASVSNFIMTQVVQASDKQTHPILIFGQCSVQMDNASFRGRTVNGGTFSLASCDLEALDNREMWANEVESHILLPLLAPSFQI